MFSTIVLEPCTFPRGEAGRALVVRSLGWLVGAAVAGVAGEVVIAASPALALEGVSDAVGSRLVEAEDERGRLRAAAALARRDAVLVMVAGFAPGELAVEELSRLEVQEARLLLEPATLPQRLFPGRAPVVGVLASAARLRGADDFAALTRASRAVRPLLARARRLG